MKVLLSFAAAGLAVVTAGSAAQAQYHHGGHAHGGHVHGGYYGGGHVHGGFYGGHLHGGYYGGHVHGGHLHVLPSAGFYYGSSYPYSYGFSSYYPSVVASPVLPSATAIVPVSGGTSTSLTPNPLPAYTGPGVTLRLPAEFRGSVYVTVDKREVELKPGSEVVLKDKASYVVEFDRGGDFGAARQELSEGTYKLVVGEKGWQVSPDAPANGGLRPNPLPLPGPPK